MTPLARARIAAPPPPDLTRERVSLWRSRTWHDLKHLASTRALYQAMQVAESLAEDLFLFNAPAAPGEGN